MKNIDFKKITIKNFLSVGPEPVVIDFKEGLNLVQGINRDEEGTRNGAGKCLDKRTKIKVRMNDEIFKIFSRHRS